MSYNLPVFSVSFSIINPLFPLERVVAHIPLETNDVSCGVIASQCIEIAKIYADLMIVDETLKKQIIDYLTSSIWCLKLNINGETINIPHQHPYDFSMFGNEIIIGIE